MRLLEPFALGPRTASNRVLFGPHVTNLADDARQLTQRHVAYYRARAAGGCGTIVVEGASVHPSDWPYERAPLASRCADGWASISSVCHEHGALAIASLDHAGGQGSSAFSQSPLWAPSRVPEVNTREVPKWMEPEDIAAVVDGFAAAAASAIDAGCDGVEINAGQHSLVRQFMSGLTNQRGDEWGQDRLLFARSVIAAVHRGVAGRGTVTLRLSCDELAPWAGITPEMAADVAVALAGAGLDAIVVVRGAIFSAEQTRPDFHEQTGFNIGVCRSVRTAVQSAHPATAIVLQGSVVEWGQAEWAVDDGVCDGVEMTRAQIADPALVSRLRDGEPHRIRPCIRCNQTCQVRDARNPIVTCVGEPTSGRETEDPDWYVTSHRPRSVTVVGAGVAGLEAARVAATRGHHVEIVEEKPSVGGVANVAGPGGALVAWLHDECQRLGVHVRLSTRFDGAANSDVVVQATGAGPGVREYATDDDALVLDITAVRDGSATLPAEGVIALFDPIGGPIAVALAEDLGARSVLITQDQIAGNELSRTGDLAPANVRLARQGVRIERRSLLREVHRDSIVLQDRFSGERRTVQCVALVDCGFRLPTAALPSVAVQIGDCVAPRTIHEAVLEARRAALAI